MSEERWVILLRILSKFRLPPIESYHLNNLPYDLNEARDFMKNSIQTQNKFSFNIKAQVQIEGSIYFEALKSAASKTFEYFGIHNANLSAQEFWGIVNAAKNCKSLHFQSDLISFYWKASFGKEMGGCKIEFLSLLNSGSSEYSDWSQHPKRFENLIATINKCDPLKKSLKELNIKNWGITEEKAKEEFEKYNITGINIIV